MKVTVGQERVVHSLPPVTQQEIKRLKLAQIHM